ncbi:GDSL esterase/lipase [Tripterygium wilfordii]|uniref:GDSL esterase/lipase n=1 Tax=Tripterygium wilfordii TaxID=458696 RepID=A0A7J7DKL4_TRIWF|nr:GDSL esterase/lipase At5g14450 [Tripterygium wilfordii]KAF5746905.1 GDSL esterase/lipase [Tripterygium wilfordii]
MGANKYCPLNTACQAHSASMDICTCKCRALLSVGFIVSWVLSVSCDTLPPCVFPAIYNFGDSNSDTGGISAAFEPIRAPYGEAFFHKSAGRDSDGRLIIDFIAERFKLPYLSAYLNSLGTSYGHGANFATGGSSIRRQNETIFEYGISPFSLDMQIVQFDQFRSRSGELYKEAKDASDRAKLPRPEDFSKALYTFDIGQNDLSVGFRKMNSDQFHAAMPDIINQLASAVQHLYQQGGRAFWIHNTGPIGCLPVNLFYVHNPAPGYLDEHGCVKGQNDMAVEFNRQLKERVAKLRAELPEAAVTYVDVYAAKYGLISNAKNQGFADPLKVCCGYHENYDHIWCGNKGTVNKTEVYGAPCKDPSVFVSWDGVHYTQGANQWVADHTQNGSLTDPPIPITHACHRQ